MKTKSVISVVMFLAVMMFGTVVMAQKAGESTVNFKADVTCQNCKGKIEKNMAYEKGVVSVNADIDADLVTVTYKLDVTNPDALSAALKNIGFENSVEGSANVDTSKCEIKCKKKCCPKNGGKCEPGCDKTCCKKDGKCEPRCQKKCSANNNEKKQ